MTNKKTAVATLVVGLISASVCQVAMAQADDEKRYYQTTSAFGEKLYTAELPALNMSAQLLDRALVEAEANFVAEITVDSATWYGRLLGYKGRHRKAIEVLTVGLEEYPDSPKLLRHRAHRYFSLREFDNSIEDGLEAARLFEGKPLEREKPGPEYFPGDPDIVQFYTYYHLGQALFATRSFAEAANWFDRAMQVSMAHDDHSGVTSSVYWFYLSAMRAGDIAVAKARLDAYQLTLDDLRDTTEAHSYFDGLQVFKRNRSPQSFLSPDQLASMSERPDLIAASNAYTVANFYINQARPELAKPYLRRAVQVDTWALFARIQAESDWVYLFGDEKP